MSKISNIEVGDLLISREGKAPWIVLESKPYHKKAYGTLVPTGRKKILVMSHAGQKEWLVDTAVKVRFYLPGDPWFEDIR
tara:strand:- start:2249 stop:2488 length:240 start_codon:yes stop_codon:yes gene_type:complete